MLLIKALSVVVPVLYWMGLIQGDRKIDGLDRWDGTLTSLFVPPHLLRKREVAEAEPRINTPENCPTCLFARSDDGSPVQLGFKLPGHDYSNFEYDGTSSNTTSTPQESGMYLTLGYLKRGLVSRVKMLSSIAYLGIVTCTALAVEVRTLVKYSSLLSAFQNLKTQIETSVQPHLKDLINKYHRTNAANKCYSELTDVLFGDNKFLRDRVDLLMTNATIENFSETGNSSSGLIPENDIKSDDNNRQTSPTTEFKQTHSDALRGQREFLEGTVHEKDLEIDCQRGQKERLLSDVGEKAQDLEDLRIEKHEAESKLRDRNEEVKSLRDDNVTLQSELTSKERRMGRIASNSRDRERKIRNLEAEKENIEQDLRERDRRIEALEGEKTTLKENVESLEGEKENTEHDLRERDRGIEALEGENKNLKLKVQEKDRTIGTLEGENTALKEDIQGKNQSIETLKGEVRELKQDVQDRDQVIGDLRPQLASVQARVHELEATMTTVQGELDRHKTVVLGLKAELTLRKRDQEDRKPTRDGKVGGYSLKGTDLHEATFVAGEIASKIPVPARPPTPEKKATPMANALPPKPSFTGFSTPSKTNKTPKSSPSPNPGSSAGSDLLPSLLNGPARPKGSVPPLLPHHQSFGAGQSSSQVPSANPSSNFPGFSGFPGLGTPPTSTPTGFSPLNPGAAKASSSSSSSIFSSELPVKSGPFTGFAPSNGSLFSSNASNQTNTSKLPIKPGPSSAFAPSKGSLFSNDAFGQFNNSKLSNESRPISGSTPSSGSLFSNHTFPQSDTSRLPTASRPFSDFASPMPSSVKGPSVHQDSTFPNIGPTPGPLPLGFNQQNGAMPFHKAVSDAMSPVVGKKMEEKKPTAGPDALPFKPMPMPKRRVLVSKAGKPWPVARQTDGETCWQTDESMSWPHTRQINGRPNWR
ncbi:MAG: hypothetical protein ALECFALPRED_005073 [Alectoria fallacina]|uniref:Uncharacterized protein n=1 Tax=Alectoria fallacina TaxID=1903189 RepID=A0A8H3IWW5_9LECA|nr:MAG: hypothetical protein ALECFALPRED_005073 [Alectoria fallacina]